MNYSQFYQAVCSAAVRPAVAAVAVAVGVPTFAEDHTVSAAVSAVGYPAVLSTLLLPVFVLLLAYFPMLVYMLAYAGFLALSGVITVELNIFCWHTSCG